MGSKTLKSQLCLLLLLGLLLMLVSCQAQTPSQWFEIQHIYNSAYPRCDDAMRVIHGYSGVYLQRQEKYKCHDSSSKIPVIICDLITWSNQHTHCRYKTTVAMKSYTVACNPRTPRNSPRYPFVPCHLDGTI
ncbi:mCG140346 [Mus musculus]|nr:mCG140346 [Mus musculus]